MKQSNLREKGTIGQQKKQFKISHGPRSGLLIDQNCWENISNAIVFLKNSNSHCASFHSSLDPFPKLYAPSSM
jgi:hypothetical protein